MPEQALRCPVKQKTEKILFKTRDRKGERAMGDSYACKAEMGHVGWKKIDLRTREEWPDKMQYTEKEGQDPWVGEGGRVLCVLSTELTDEGHSIAKQGDKLASD